MTVRLVTSATIRILYKIITILSVVWGFLVKLVIRVVFLAFCPKCRIVPAVILYKKQSVPLDTLPIEAKKITLPHFRAEGLRPKVGFHDLRPTRSRPDYGQYTDGIAQCRSARMQAGALFIQFRPKGQAPLPRGLRKMKKNCCLMSVHDSTFSLDLVFPIPHNGN